jgi:Type II secretion system (T2SS), protein M subtype b
MRIAAHLSGLPHQVQRVLALLVVPAALVVAWAGVIWPVSHAYQAQVEWRATAAQQLAQRRGLAAIEGVVRTQLDALPQFQSWNKLYRTPGDASAVIALQTEINSVLNSARVRPQSLAPLEGVDVGPLRKVGLRIAAPMMIDQLREVLLRVDGLTHLVRIEQLIINAPPVQGPKENPTLTVTMDVVAYALEEPETAAAIETRQP